MNLTLAEIQQRFRGSRDDEEKAFRFTFTEDYAREPFDHEGRFIGLADDVITGKQFNSAGFGWRVPDDSVILTVHLGDELLYNAGEPVDPDTEPITTITAREVEIIRAALEDAGITSGEAFEPSRILFRASP